MKTFTHSACLVIGITAGFVPGTWKGQITAMQAPGIDPTYADATSDIAVYRTRAPMALKSAR